METQPGQDFSEQVKSWISNHYPTRESAIRQCLEATRLLVEAFPSLVRVRGHAVVGVDFKPHWWCVTPEGEVVDPTAHQWSEPVVFYDAIDENCEEPSGKCMNCGDLIYRSLGGTSYFCYECGHS